MPGPRPSAALEPALGSALDRKPLLARLAAPARLAAVDRVVAQGGSGPALNRLAAMAARLVHAPQAQIGLVAAEHLVAAAHGVVVEPADRVIDLRESLCAVTVAVGGPLVVTDARTHPWVSGLTAVTSGAVRSALAVPLVDGERQALGALCVTDRVPREWSAADLSALCAVGEAVLEEFAHPTEAAQRGWRSGAGGLWWPAPSAADVGSFDLEFGTGLVSCDDRLAAFFDLPVGAPGYPLATVLERIHPADVERVQRELAEVRDRGGEYTLDHRVLRRTGEVRWLSVHGVVVTDIVGRAARLVGQASDTTVVRNDRDEMARVLETSTGAFFRLSSDLTFTYVNSEAERMLGHRRDELLGVSVREVFPGALGDTFQEHYQHAVLTGQPVNFESSWPALDSWLDVRVWPDQAGLSVYFRDIGDRKVAEFARVRAAQRLELLARASDALSASLDCDEVLAAASSFVLPAYAEWVAFTVRDDLLGPTDGGPGQADRVRVASVLHADPDRDTALRELLLHTTSPTAALVGPGAVLRTGQPEWQPEVTEDWLRSWAEGQDEQVEALRAQGLQSALTLPLISRDRVLGAMTVAQPAASTHVRLMLTELASRTAAALDNALQYATERRMGLDLQRSLLPGEVPTLPGISIATRYLPATEGALTGGDLHQVVVCAEHLVLALGDVEGHGMTSAARMGQLRAAVAALALETYEPGHLLGRLAANTDQLLDISLATLLVASYAPAQRVLKVASAGHPPAVLVVPGRPAVLLEVEPGPPLGVLPSSYDEVTVDLPVGTLVVLYSDGLVERRDESLTCGLERLRLVAEHAARLTDLEQVADDILEAMGLAGGGDDDIALLVLRHP